MVNVPAGRGRLSRCRRSEDGSAGNQSPTPFPNRRLGRCVRLHAAFEHHVPRSCLSVSTAGAGAGCLWRTNFMSANVDRRYLRGLRIGCSRYALGSTAREPHVRSRSAGHRPAKRSERPARRHRGRGHAQRRGAEDRSPHLPRAAELRIRRRRTRYSSCAVFRRSPFHPTTASRFSVIRTSGSSSTGGPDHRRRPRNICGPCTAATSSGSRSSPIRPLNIRPKELAASSISSSAGSGQTVRRGLRRRKSGLRDGRGDASFKVKNGKWTLELAGAFDTGRTHSTYRKHRSVENAIGTPATIDEERGGGPTDETSGYGSGKISYDIDPRTSISANVIGIGYRTRSLNLAHFEAVTPDFESFDEHQVYASSGSFLIGELAFDHKGSKDGETLTASLTTSSNPRQPETDRSEFSTGGSLFTERVKAYREQKGQVDWAAPDGEGPDPVARWHLGPVAHQRALSLHQRGHRRPVRIRRGRPVRRHRRQADGLYDVPAADRQLDGDAGASNRRQSPDHQPGAPRGHHRSHRHLPDAAHRPCAEQGAEPHHKLQPADRPAAAQRTQTLCHRRGCGERQAGQPAPAQPVDRCLRDQPPLSPRQTGCRRPGL